MKLKLITTLALTLGAVPLSQAGIFGSLSNFDVINSTGKPAHGFEIDMKDMRATEVPAAFGDASRGGNPASYPMKVNRFGAPTVTEYSDSTAVRTGKSVKVTYMATWTGSGWSATTPTGSLPQAPMESCWPYGSTVYAAALNAAKASGSTIIDFPCDHYGVSTNAAPASTTYTWLVESAPGSSSVVAEQVPVANPVFTVVPSPLPPVWVQPAPAKPADPLPPMVLQPQPPVVHAVFAAAPPINYEFGDVQWVKVTATGTDKPVAMEGLVAENAEVKKAHTQVQIEWQRLQFDAGKTGGGANGTIDLSGVKLDQGVTGVIYTMEYYTYTGAFDPETHEAITGVDTSGAAAKPATAGTWISTQQAGVNFDGSVPPAPALPIAPTIDAAITDAVIGQQYSATINAIPGNLGDTLDYVITGLPSGISASGNVISGVPTAIGSSLITITVNDVVNGTSMSASTNFNVLDAPIVFLSALADAIVDKAYSKQLTATGGTGVFTFSTVSKLPVGLTLDSNSGVLAGTPTAIGASLVTFTATDSAGYHTNASQTLNVVAAPVVVPPVVPPVPVVIACSGNNEIVTSVLAGSISTSGSALSIVNPANITFVPPAVAINAGSIVSYSGDLDQAGTSCMATTMAVQDGLSVPAITLPNGIEGAVYTDTAIVPAGGIKPYSISVTGLPVGLVWDGVNITGTPLAPDTANGVQGASGLYDVTISVSDNIGTALSQIVPLTIDTAACSGTKEVITGFGGVRGSNAWLSTTTGAHRVIYPSQANTILIAPAKFAMGEMVTYSGKMDQPGVFCKATIMTVEAAPAPVPALVIGSATVSATGTTGQAFTGSVTSTGGVGAVTWSMTGQPAGVVIDVNTGVISGIPTAANTFTLAITATDSIGQTVSTSLATVISYPALLLGNVTVPATGVTGTGFSGSVVVTGGVGAITWTATGLPAGISINATTGAITGAPTAAGTFAIAIVATDSVGQKISTSATTVISAPVPPAASCTKPAGYKAQDSVTGKITAVYADGFGIGAKHITVPACAKVELNGGAKGYAVGQTAEWKGYINGNNGLATIVTIN